MRLALGRGLVGVVVGEMLASTAGVGHMMTLASDTFQMDKMFVWVNPVGWLWLYPDRGSDQS